MTIESNCIKASRLIRRDERGSVVVEFGLIASILLMFLAGMIDLVFMVSAGRDLERTSAQLAAMLTVGCETSSRCVEDRILLYNDRKANTIVLYDTAAVRMANIAKANDTIAFCGGNTTFIDAEPKATALSVLDNNDSAVAVTIQLNYVPFLPVSLATFASGTKPQLKRHTISLRTKEATCGK